MNTTDFETIEIKNKSNNNYMDIGLKKFEEYTIIENNTEYNYINTIDENGNSVDKDGIIILNNTIVNDDISEDDFEGYLDENMMKIIYDKNIKKINAEENDDDDYTKNNKNSDLILNKNKIKVKPSKSNNIISLSPIKYSMLYQRKFNPRFPCIKEVTEKYIDKIINT